MKSEALSEYYDDPALYDLLYAHLTDDVAFYVEAAKRAKGPVLEVGCGTGRVLVPTLEAGVDIDGLDVHAPMLEGLRRKAEARGLTPRVVEGDMRDFTMPRRYALLTCPFRAFQHMLTTDDQLRALRCMREHLEAGGALAFNVFFPSFDKIATTADEPIASIETVHPETGLPVVAWDRPTYDRVNQIVSVEREVQESDARGYVSRTIRTAFRMRWIWRAEMELLLRTAGFARWEVRGGFDGRPLERDTDEMVWTAWKD